jgi:hypothetical protein
MSDRRLLPRVPQNQPVQISLLNPPLLDAAKQGVFTGTCLDMSLAGACFRIDRPLDCGTLIRVETPDSLWLGEVVHCRPDGDTYLIGTHFEHSVIGLGQLQRTLQRLDWNPSRDRAESDPKKSSSRV